MTKTKKHSDQVWKYMEEGNIPTLDKYREGESVLNAFLWDRVIQQNMRNDPDNLFAMVNGELASPLDKALEDLFLAGYKYNASLKPVNWIDPIFRGNRKLIQKIMRMSEFKEIHERTKGDEILAATAAISFMDELQSTCPDEMKKLTENAQGAQQATERMDKLRDHINNMKQAMNTPDLSAAERKALRNQIKALRTQERKTTIQLQQANKGMRKAMSKMTSFKNLKGALTDSKQNVDDLSDIEKALGYGTKAGNEIGSGGRVYDKKRFQIAKILRTQDKLKRIFKELGRFQFIATRKFKTKIRHATGEITKIIQSNNLAYVLPSEWVNLMIPELEILFYKRYAEKELLSYETKQKGKKGKGAIIVCVDESSSMRGVREVWSKAVSLALLTLARMQHRTVHIVTFGSNISKQFTFPPKMKESKHFDEMLDFATFFDNGGTSFYPPLDKARKLIQRTPELKKAYILFITDGEAGLSDEYQKDFNEFKKRNEVTMQTIIIGHDGEGYGGSVLKGVSDKMTYIEELTDKIAEDLFEKI